MAQPTTLRALLYAALAFSLATTRALAQEPPATPSAVADAYLERYAAGNVNGLEPLLDSDAVFEDPTTELAGRDEILDGLRGVFAALTIEDYTVERRIDSGPHHVLAVGQVRFAQDGASLGRPGETLRFDVPLAVALRIDGGLVTRHVDFVDTGTYLDQLRSQLGPPAG